MSYNIGLPHCIYMHERNVGSTGVNLHQFSKLHKSAWTDSNGIWNEHVRTMTSEDPSDRLGLFTARTLHRGADSGRPWVKSIPFRLVPRFLFLVSPHFGYRFPRNVTRSLHGLCFTHQTIVRVEHPLFENPEITIEILRVRIRLVRVSSETWQLYLCSYCMIYNHALFP